MTAGMPYGNKDLHFGHVGGVFIHADAYARFLRDRLGPENVLFICGTDCYGSPIVAEYQKQVAGGAFAGSITDYVLSKHNDQRETLGAFQISLDLFAASALEPYRETHEAIGALLMEKAYRHGFLEKRSNPQFYDVSHKTFLNGRQVIGRCPIQGCRSDKAYADECALGHQYEPDDLIDPVSVLSGERPEKRSVTNWYLPLERFRDTLRPYFERLLQSGEWREFAVRVVLEYFEPPAIYVKRETLAMVPDVVKSLPPHRQEPAKGESDKLVFESVAAQEEAKKQLARHHVRYRSGKMLVPFRLTGNLSWGLTAPTLEGLEGLTFWVWPESLWAPISFTASALHERGATPDSWKDWWCSKAAKVYQFIGEDNLFFYGVAEPALFMATQEGSVSTEPKEGELQMPCIIANRHLLFLDKKASSSGTVRPPMARELLSFYSSDQLRIHFLSLALGTHNVSFRPKPLDPEATPASADPILKAANLLTNAFNTAVRSCFYTAQKYYERRLPGGAVSEAVAAIADEVIFAYERAMAKQQLQTVVELVAAFIRAINSRWTEFSPYRPETSDDVRRQALIDAFHMVRVAVVLLHPIAPNGTEKVRRYLGVGEEIWSWSRIFDSLESFFKSGAEHQFAYLAPKEDFFEKPACQFPPAPESAT